MSINVGRTQLTSAFKELNVHWREVREHWSDAKAEQFEQDYLSQLEPGVRAALTAMERMAEVLEKARRECE
jgi:hypothetical protein